jgi:hypothetical protein
MVPDNLQPVLSNQTLYELTMQTIGEITVFMDLIFHALYCCKR